MRGGPKALVVGWFVACGLALLGIGAIERNARLEALIGESERLQALASQRVDQHDAHLTALSAIAVAGVDQRPELFREVAAAIMRFYPRIVGVALVPLNDATARLSIGADDAGLDAIIREAAGRSTGAPVLVRHPADRPAYLIVKRSPNTDAARYGLALMIDAAALLDDDSPYWSQPETMRRLALPDGTPLFGRLADGVAPQFSRALSSGTQPLLLETAVTMTPADLLPPGRVALVLTLITVVALAIHATMQQRARFRDAEKRAELSGLESRLSHAARVNALGEMASGMAHELTQPLTAILAQAQAARHLAARGETGKLAEVLDEVVGQTKRASAILERLRTWTRPQARHPEPVDLGTCLGVAETLLAGQASEIGAHLSVRRPAAPLSILADRVEIEQVLFNLIRNALDAVADTDGPREVAVLATRHGDTAVVEISDTGPGIRADIRERLFTPFVTTREGGTGLGLALSQRLVERAGGELSAVESADGARFRVTLPLARHPREVSE